METLGSVGTCGQVQGICPRCNCSCHAAEERLALDGKSWHTECFTCAVCNKGLDSVSLQECRETMEIYCRQCYRRFCLNPGYGYGPNEPTLISDQSTAKCEMMANMNDQNSPPFCPPPSRLGRDYTVRVPHPPLYTNQAIIKRNYDDCEPSNTNQNPVPRMSQPLASMSQAPSNQCHCPYSGAGAGNKRGINPLHKKSNCPQPHGFGNNYRGSKSNNGC